MLVGSWLRAFRRQWHVVNAYTTIPVRPLGGSTITASYGDARNIFQAGVDAVLPSNMIQNAVKVNGATLSIREQNYTLNRNVHIVAFGKAVLGMIRAVEDLTGDHVVSGVASVPVGIQQSLREMRKFDMLPRDYSRVQIYEGAKNNIPDAAAHQTALKINHYARSLTENDLLITLISGGGSALLPAPLKPLTLDDVATVTKVMSRGGADIQQLNTVRKQLELLKGGGLAKAAYPSKVVSLILSDVIGSPLDLIASGPTVPDRSNAGQCLSLFSRLGVQSYIPTPVIELLQRTADNSTHAPSPDHFYDVQNVIVGSNEIAIEAARDAARKLGYVPCVLSTELAGEVSILATGYSHLASHVCECISAQSRRDWNKLGDYFTQDTLTRMAAAINEAKDTGRPLCMLGAGEPIVNVTGSGIGGRNQELALDIAINLDQFPISESIHQKTVTFLSAGTDGQDGPTDAAGAVVQPTLFGHARQQGLDPVQYLNNNDSHSFFYLFDRGENLIQTGLTGTNVMDIHVLLIQH